MIISKTPMRLSFAGGGSDLPVYYREYGGAVLSTSIDKFIYICLNKAFDHRVRVAYSRTEEVNSSNDVEHPLVRAALNKLGIAGGVEIASIADIPSGGSGLGSSSAFTVGLLHALHAYLGQYRSRQDLAAEACTVEIDICGEPIGKQDQFGAAMGGINYIRFNPDETVDVEPVMMPGAALRQMEQSLMMFYTGVVRSASELLKTQADNLASDAAKRRSTRRMVELAGELCTELRQGRPDSLGEIMHEGWELKKSLATGITGGVFDDAYARARQAGALGGKLLGAGGGGFLLFYVPEDRREAVKKALHPMTHTGFALDHRGTTVVFHN